MTAKKEEAAALLDSDFSSDSDSVFGDGDAVTQFSTKRNGQKEDVSDEVAELNFEETEPEATGCAFFRKHKWTTSEIITNIAMFVYQLGWGVAIGMVGPAFLDIQARSHTTVAQMSLGYTATMLGSMVCSIIGGYILDVVDIRFYFMMSTLYQGVMLSVYGWLATSFLRLIAVSVCLGTSMGFVGCGATYATMVLWGYGGNILMQAFHATFGIGTVVAPWIVAPFIVNTDGKSDSSDNVTSITTSSSPDNFSNSVPDGNVTATDSVLTSNVDVMDETDSGLANDRTRIQYAFSLVSIWFILVSTLFLTAYLAKKKERSQENGTSTVKNSQTTVKSAPERPFEPLWYRIPMLVLTGLRFGTYVGLESQYAAYLTAFTVKGLGRSKTDGLALTSTYRTAFTISRVVNIAVALCLTPMKMIIVDVIVIICAYGFLVGTVEHFRWAVWLGSVVAGLGMGSFFGASVSWTEKQLKITGKTGAVIGVGDTSGVMLITFTIGHLFDSLGPMSFMYVCLVDSIVIAFICALCFVWSRYYWRRKTGYNRIAKPASMRMR